MSKLTINHSWAAAPEPLEVVTIMVRCESGELSVEFESADPQSKVLTAEGICAISPALYSSRVETVGDCNEYISLADDAQCNFESVQFSDTIPTMNAWGASVMVLALGIAAAWFLRK